MVMGAISPVAMKRMFVNLAGNRCTVTKWRISKGCDSGCHTPSRQRRRGHARCWWCAYTSGCWPPRWRWAATSCRTAWRVISCSSWRARAADSIRCASSCRCGSRASGRGRGVGVTLPLLVAQAHGKWGRLVPFVVGCIEGLVVGIRGSLLQMW